MKLLIALCLCLALTQATPIDRLRQDAARAKFGSPSFVEKQASEVTSFEMEKEKNEITEAVEVQHLAKDPIQGDFNSVNTNAPESPAVQTPTPMPQPSAAAPATSLLAKADQKKTDTQAQAPKKDEKKPMEWEDAVLVDDLTKERAGADANTRYIGANMKSSVLGTKKDAKPAGASLLQFGPPMYYPMHPAMMHPMMMMHPSFLQQTQHAESSEGRAQQGAQTRGWGDQGTPLYFAQDYGSYDGLGAGGANMYGPYSGYNPYAGYDASAYLPQPIAGFTPGGGYASPYGSYANYAPPQPPAMPVDLPAPPFIQRS